MFSILPNTNFNIWVIIILSSANAFNLNQSRNLSFGNELTLSQLNPCFYVSAVKVFWKHFGKRRNCSLRAISSFPAVFSTHLEKFLPFLSILKLSSANPLSLEESKICRLGKSEVVVYLDSLVAYVFPFSNKPLSWVLFHSSRFDNQFIKPLPDDKILDWFKLKEIADDILRCIWNEK